MRMCIAERKVPTLKTMTGLCLSTVGVITLYMYGGLGAPVWDLIQFLSVPLVDQMAAGQEVGLEVPVQHVLHHSVHGLITRTHAQQLHDVLQSL